MIWVPNKPPIELLSAGVRPLDFKKAITYDRVGVTQHFPGGGIPTGSLRVTLTGHEGVLSMYPGDSIAARRRNKGDAKRIDRITEIESTFEGPTHSVDWIRLTTPGASLHISSFGHLLSPAFTRVTTSYVRANGKSKVLMRFFLFGEIPTADSAVYLDKFDAIYAIDTNTKPDASGNPVSVTAIVECIPGGVSVDGARSAQFTKVQTIVFDSDSDAYERIGWRLGIDHIQQINSGTGRTKFAIIVDSDLGLLEDVARRKVPIFEDQYLPNDFEIIYTSDASGSDEYLPCQLIRMADGFAKEQASG
jgi:hypothetical protein